VFIGKKPEEIIIGEIINLTEGSIDLVFWVGEKSRKRCERLQECVTRDVWGEAGRILKEYFDSVVIKNLCDRAREK